MIIFKKELIQRIKDNEIVVIIPKKGSHYRDLLFDFKLNEIGEANFWTEFDMPVDRIEAVKLWTNKGKSPGTLKENSYLRVNDPYTLEALELYGDKTDLKFVYIDDNGINLYLKDDIKEIYRSFFEPFQVLENLRSDLE